MKRYEYTAKTTEEAIAKGLEELGLSISDVDIKVLEEGSKGLFGLFGSRPAKVSITVKEEEEDLLAAVLGEEKKPAKPAKAPKAEKPAQAEKKPAPAKVEKTEKAEKVEAKPEKKAEKKPEKKENAPKPRKVEKTEKPEKV